MSHEIRTPMNGILGFAELLKDPKLSGEDQQMFIDIIKKSGERMLNIINDLINISKVESGQMEISFSETNVNIQIDFLFNFFKLEAKQKGLNLSVSCSLPINEAFIITDREKVYAILTNLIKNAIKFTNSGSIEFGYQLKENMYEFFVKDTGIGIPINKQSTIFERFIQADISLSRGYEGAGLGLSISKAYVEMLGGEIMLTSEPGVGSQFNFTIPINVKSEIKQHKTDAVFKLGNEILNSTILIAEDDETALLYYTQILKKSCLKLFVATTGKEAVEICKSNFNIDIVLMDIKMPIMDGHTAAIIIKEFRPNLPIIAQTAFALETEKERFGKPFDGYITKPIKIAEMIQKINSILKKQTSICS
jgi:CheY-like chemotaxis protein